MENYTVKLVQITLEGHYTLNKMRDANYSKKLRRLHYNTDVNYRVIKKRASIKMQNADTKFTPRNRGTYTIETDANYLITT